VIRRAALLAAFLMVLSTGSASAATYTVKMSSYAFTPKYQTVTLGNAVRWKNVSGRRHTATPVVNWSWGGVSVAAGSAKTVWPTQTGSFPYYCSLHPSKMKGTVSVAMTVSPSAGSAGTLFTVTLGTVQAPGVSVHQVEVRVNGGAWQLRATTASPSTSIMITQAGTWDIRTRMRWQLGSQTSEWSPMSTVEVF
jgi:plastocyanin